MNRIKALFYTFLLTGLAFPLNTYGHYPNFEASVPLYSVYLEVLIFSIVVVVAGIVIQTLNKLSGRLKVGWYFLLLASVMFALTHLIELLEIFYAKNFNILLCFVETSTAIAFLLAILTFKNIFQKIITEKSLSPDNKE